MAKQATVAVVGLGPNGLVALKNLEQHFDATGFERAHVVGGLWNYGEEDRTSVLESTVSNISKQRSCFTDFPYPQDTPDFPPAQSVHQYLREYAKHFDLTPRIRLRTEVIAIERDEPSETWRLTIKCDDTRKVESFDKLVLATGINKLPLMPKIENINIFQGKIVHSSGYKRPSSLQDKSVLVVGISNSAADTATSLIGHARQVYISRRRDAFVISRYVDGKPFDHSLSHRQAFLAHLMQMICPRLSDWLVRKILTKLHNKGSAAVTAKMNLSTAPLPERGLPIVSDSFLRQISEGKVILVPGISKILGPQEVLLDGGDVITVDAIVFCIGYRTDYQLAGPFDPALAQPKEWTAAVGSNSRALPRLYRDIFSMQLPHSLAFMGSLAVPPAAFQMSDLAAMTLAQVWSGKTPLPSLREMNAHVDKQQKWLIKLASSGTVLPGWVKRE